MSYSVAELQTQLTNSSERCEQVDLMNSLAIQMRYDDLPRAMALCQKAIELSNSEDLPGESYPKGLADSLFNLAQFNVQLSNYNLAQTLLFKAFLQYDTLRMHLQGAQVLSVLGQVYMDLGDYPNSLDYFLGVLEMSRDMEDLEIQAKALTFIGEIYLRRDDLPNALAYLSESFTLAEQLGNLDVQADVLGRRSKAYYLNGEFENAVQYAQKSIALYRQTRSRQGEAEALINLGDLQQRQGFLPDALENYRQALDVANSIGQRYLTVLSLQKIGEIYRLQGKPDRSLHYLGRALEIADNIDARQAQYECHQALGEAYKQIGDFEKALDHFAQYHAIKESQFDDDADLRIKNLEMGYKVETARREMEIAQQKNLALQQEIQFREQTELALQFANERLVKEAYEHDQLISDLNAFAHMVAHDLKDPLAGLMLASRMLETNLAQKGNVPELDLVRTINHTTLKMNDIIEELLLLASVREQDVVVQPFDMGEVVAEAENRLGYMLSQARAHLIKPDSWPTALGYPPWVEEVWVNYISNAIKYGGSQPRIELGAGPVERGLIRFWVRDSGDGLIPQAQADIFKPAVIGLVRVRGHGLGLSIVKRIVNKLGGDVGVESTGRRGQGSTFFFTLAASR